LPKFKSTADETYSVNAQVLRHLKEGEECANYEKCMVNMQYPVSDNFILK
jgi:hypothetical protein